VLALLFVAASVLSSGQNVVVVVIDGGRYTETLGAGETYLPHLWTDLRPLGTYWTNFRNEGITSTVSGHSSIETGTWQMLPNG
jgi:hypothetical protein